MSSITTINSTDLITNSRTVINTNFSNLNTDKIETSTLDTDTTLATNSDSKIATQKATKAYVDALAVRASSTYPNTSVFSAIPTGGGTYQDLSLVSVIGVTQKTVLLRVVATATSGTGAGAVQFRKKGEANAVPTGAGAGASSFTHTNINQTGYAIILTNASGVIELQGSNTNTYSIIVECYW
jgi:hypothetical protein